MLEVCSQSEKRAANMHYLKSKYHSIFISISPPFAPNGIILVLHDKLKESPGNENILCMSFQSQRRLMMCLGSSLESFHDILP